MRIVAGRVRVLVIALAALTVGLAVQARGVPPTDQQAIAQSQVGTTGQQTTEPPPKGTGLLLGQVVDVSTSKPVGGVTVTITGGPQTTPVGPTVDVLAGTAAALGAAGLTAPTAPRQIITDAEGRFLFRELSKGRYSIRTAAPAYVSGGYGQTSPTAPPQSIELTRDDEKRGDIMVRIWKTATIAGTITDENGDPVIGYSLRVFRKTMAGGRSRLSSGATVTTDDRGMYRAAALIPGEYLVGVMSTQTTMPVATAEEYMQQMQSGGSSLNSEIYRELSNSGAPSGLMGGYRVGELVLQASATGRGQGSGAAPAPTEDGKVFVYPSQFYPSAGAVPQATVITLASGQERSGIDLQMKLVQAVRVSGTVMGPDGPGRNLGVKLFPAGAEAFITESGIEVASTATDANGSFTFLGVTPGDYTLKSLRIPRPVSSSSPQNMTTIEVSGPNGLIMGMSSSSGPSPSQPLPTDPTLWATMPVSVGETDLGGLSVTLRGGVRVSGRMVFEGTKDPPTPDQLLRGSISINLTGSQPIQISLAPKRVEADGRFNSVGFPPGRYNFSASVPAPGWTLKSAVLGGHDLSDEGLEIGAEDVSGIVVTFTDRTSDLSGSVIDAKGLPDKAATVIILPADSQVWKQGVLNARRLRNIRVSTTGGFLVSNLPPGDYFLAAVADDALADWQDPKVLEKIAAVGTRITLAEGEKKVQALTTRTIR